MKFGYRTFDNNTELGEWQDKNKGICIHCISPLPKSVTCNSDSETEFESNVEFGVFVVFVYSEDGAVRRSVD